MTPTTLRRPRRSFAAHIALLITLFGALAGTAAAQDDATFVTEIYRLRHVEPGDVRQVLHMLKIRFTVDNRLNAIIVDDLPDRQTAAKEIIAALDVPLDPVPSLEITVSVLEATREGDGGDLPAALAGVVEQLTSVLGFSGARVLDSVLIRTTEGRGGRVDGGITVGPDGGHRLGYQIGFERAMLLDRGERRDVRLQELRFSAFDLIDGEAVTRASIRTSVELEEGQTAVVGRATPMAPGGTLVLVVNATILE